ncbi:hypothetical protein B296_00018404 [Ensete ventricosum]|uniref:Uncharacterized protein n=1 Tax=Ensete ventricosum TaxID=4639 RepID=A0A426ZQ45_ENSVE|nr:hypothetical protein B296_00018404 [Ensete ventricosum]
MHHSPQESPETSSSSQVISLSLSLSLSCYIHVPSPGVSDKAVWSNQSSLAHPCPNHHLIADCDQLHPLPPPLYYEKTTVVEAKQLPCPPRRESSHQSTTEEQPCTHRSRRPSERERERERARETGDDGEERGKLAVPIVHPAVPLAGEGAASSVLHSPAVRRDARVLERSPVIDRPAR